MEKCVICQAATNDVLVESNQSKMFFGIRVELSNKKKSYCRAHLIGEFKRKFLSSRKKMIVIHPEWEVVENACVYGYLGVVELNRRKLYEPFVQKILLNINGPCVSCGKPGSVAYYASGTVKRQQLECGNYPDLEHPPASLPATLCTSCAFNYIEESLKKFPGEFVEGLFLPSEEEGVYCSAAL